MVLLFVQSWWHEKAEFYVRSLVIFTTDRIKNDVLLMCVFHKAGFHLSSLNYYIQVRHAHFVDSEREKEEKKINFFSC